MIHVDTNVSPIKRYILVSTGPSVWKEIPIETSTTFGPTWLATDSVETAKIKDANVTLAKMADNSVDSDQYVDGSIDLVHMSADSVDASKIVDLSVGTAELAASAVTAGKIGALAVTTTKLQDLNVTEGKLAAGAVTEAKLGAGAVTSTKLAAGVGVFWNMADKSTTYTAVHQDYIVATVGASWTLTLPASPVKNDRVGVYVDSVTGSFVLTIDGGSKDIGQQGGTMGLYVAGDRLELVYSGSKWVAMSGFVTPHFCTLEETGMARSSPGTSFLLVAFTTALDDIGVMADTANDRITVRRAGRYRVTIEPLFQQDGPYKWLFRMLKNGAALSPRIAYDNTFDALQDSALDLVGPHVSRTYTLAAADYIQADYYYYLQSGSNNQFRLTVEELDFVV
jgi:hypothetical protein